VWLVSTARTIDEGETQMNESRRALGRRVGEGLRNVRAGAALVALLGMLAGCFHTTVMVTGAQPANSVERWQHFLIGGLVPLSEQWDARTDCQAGIAKVESSMNIGNVLLTAITAGIYSSVTLKVWCAQGGGAPGAPGGRTVIVVPGSASLLRLKTEFPDLERMVREQADREDAEAQVAKLDRAAGIF
jgi:hypothetical protein